ncbi:hypothetical protein HYS93_02440 [Candidatus Daviesbacteria bacterium]|nr:hypothetical protein [Candidatus Daviesbacteria bacterium]
MYFRNTKLIFFLSLIVLVLLLIALLPYPKLDKKELMKFKSVINLTPTSQAAGKILYTPENVPELTEILSDNQEIRLKATRKLVERVDVEQALEILEHSSLPHTGEGHLAVHQIGFYAYQKYKLDSILKCKDYFLYACYHGAIIEAASDQGFEVVAGMADKCKESPLRYFQCAHAAGHAILAIWNYDLPKALNTCDEVFEKESQFPEALSSCHNGAFMENLFGVHDWGKDKTPKRDWLSDDPYFPCNYFGEKYQKGCWLNQAARIYQMYLGGIPKTAEACLNTGNKQYTDWCMDNLARQIHPLTEGDISKVFSLCQQMGSDWLNSCISVNAGSYYSVGDSTTAIEICKKISAEGKQSCYQNIIGQITSEPSSNVRKLELCSSLEEPFRTGCLSQI